jgi:sigma-B regulation protein RsbU (phosphoserine phosphatase)
MRFHDAADEAVATEPPGAANRFDLELLWGGDVPVFVWETPGRPETAILGIHSRLSALLKVLIPPDSMTDNRAVVIFWAAVLGLIQVASIYIGVTLTRTITGAVHDLSEGTARVMEGDFSHRIRVVGDDQLAGLSKSFNQMTGNVERLLQISKEKERLQAELEFARQVQTQLFPRSVPPLQHLELKGVCIPARVVSGDYYDYQRLADGRVLIALGDVAGKGASAALLMASLQACVRMQVSQGENLSAAAMMRQLNRLLHANTTPEKYATFFLALYNDSSGELEYVNAGHLPPVLIRGEKATALEVTGMVVGAFSSAAYGESHLVLQPCDLLVGYTDGVTEPENEFGEMFGEQRLIDVLLKSAQLETGRIMEAVTEAVRQFTGSPDLQDDLTLVIARRK